ncbi:MAG: aminotransferase class V-fold PLP-dependent enzyme [Alkalispirochaeta sp.]
MRLSWDAVRDEIFGRNATILTPYGERFLTYADYTASGRGLYFIEKYLQYLLEQYANTHTEDDSTGRLTSGRLAAAQGLIKERLNAGDDYYLISTGSGATSAILRLQQILGIYIPPVTRERLGLSRSDGTPPEELKSYPVVFVGPYEHHSNEISWREGLAEVVEVDLGPDGALSLDDLEAKLSDPRWKGREKIGSFSAASNVTGIRTDVYAVARTLHRHGARAFFDYSAAAPYVRIDLSPDEENYLDGVFFSPHKYLGGPGAGGILVIHKSVYRRDLPPTVSGGGTVRFVSAERQEYLENVEAREQAGTPGILQTIRAALALDLQHDLGIDAIAEREGAFLSRVYRRFAEVSGIEPIVPESSGERLAIFSFNIRYRDAYLHPRFVVRLLNDLFGIQSRAGCSCAGPYGHRLLGIDPVTSDEYYRLIHEGREGIKPGWVRLNFHYLMTDDEFEFLCDAIEFVARHGRFFLQEYRFDPVGGAWTHRDEADEVDGFGIGEALLHRTGGNDDPDTLLVDTGRGRSIDTMAVQRRYLDEAMERAYQLAATFHEEELKETDRRFIPFWYIEMETTR